MFTDIAPFDLTTNTPGVAATPQAQPRTLAFEIGVGQFEDTLAQNIPDIEDSSTVILIGTFQNEADFLSAVETERDIVGPIGSLDIPQLPIDVDDSAPINSATDRLFFEFDDGSKTSVRAVIQKLTEMGALAPGATIGVAADLSDKGLRNIGDEPSGPAEQRHAAAAQPLSGDGVVAKPYPQPQNMYQALVNELEAITSTSPTCAATTMVAA